MKIISAEELFYLGRMMNARYIDYDYIRVMKDIQKKGALKEKEYMAGLVTKGLLYEDFSGCREIDLALEQLLIPIFFGEFQSEIFYQQDINEKKMTHYKFHFHKEAVTCVQLEKGELRMTLGGEKLNQLKNMIIPENYEGEIKEVAMNELNKAMINDVMLLKNTRIGKSAMSSQFVRHSNIWYVGKKENVAESLSKDRLEEKWNQIMKGVNE